MVDLVLMVNLGQLDPCLKSCSMNHNCKGSNSEKEKKRVNLSGKMLCSMQWDPASNHRWFFLFLPEQLPDCYCRKVGLTSMKENFGDRFKI